MMNVWIIFKVPNNILFIFIYLFVFIYDSLNPEDDWNLSFLFLWGQQNLFSKSTELVLRRKHWGASLVAYINCFLLFFYCFALIEIDTIFFSLLFSETFHKCNIFFTHISLDYLMFRNEEFSMYNSFYYSAFCKQEFATTQLIH